MFKDCVLQPPKENVRKTTDILNLQYVSVLFIKKHLKSLKRNKATALDNLPPNGSGVNIRGEAIIFERRCLDFSILPLIKHLLALVIVFSFEMESISQNDDS